MFRLSAEGVHLDFYASKYDELYQAPEEFIGKRVNESLPKEVAEKYQHNIRKAFETGGIQVFEYKLDFPEGPRYYEGRMVASGKNETLTIVRNITERVQVKDALQESEARMKSIFLAAPIGIGVVSGRTLLDVNDRLCELVGYSRDELIGKNARILYPTEEEYEYVGKEKYLQQIEKQGTGSVETRFKCKDGRIINLLLKFNLLLIWQTFLLGLPSLCLTSPSAVRAEESTASDRA